MRGSKGERVRKRGGRKWEGKSELISKRRGKGKKSRRKENNGKGCISESRAKRMGREEKLGKGDREGGRKRREEEEERQKKRYWKGKKE